MQTIYKANHHARFSFVGSDFCNSKIPSDAKNVLLYLIDKPIDWKLIVKNIANTLDLSVYAVRKALRWLLDHGYASYKRLSDGRTIWQIFEQPKQAATPVMTPRVEIPNVETQHDIHITQTSPITQKTTTPPLPVQVIDEQLAIDEHDVVVQRSIDEKEPHQTRTAHSASGFEQKQTIGVAALSQGDCPNTAHGIDGVGMGNIPGIEERHQQTARKALEQLTPKQAQAVIVAFTLAASKTTISNKVGYLIRLVQSAIDGTFSPVSVTGAAPAITLDERLRRERERQQEAAQRGAMTSEQHAAWLAETFEQKPTDSPAKSGGRIGLRSMLGWA